MRSDVEYAVAAETICCTGNIEGVLQNLHFDCGREVPKRKLWGHQETFPIGRILLRVRRSGRGMNVSHLTKEQIVALS